MNRRGATAGAFFLATLLCFAGTSYAQGKGCGRRVDCVPAKPAPAPTPAPAPAPAPEPVVEAAPVLVATPDVNPSEAEIELDTGLDANLFAKWSPFDRGTLWSQAFAASGATFVGGMLGAWLGCTASGGNADIWAIINGRSSEARLPEVIDCVRFAKVGGFAGAAATGLLAVNVSGTAMGGNGSFWASALGMTLGIALPASYTFFSGPAKSNVAADLRFYSLIAGPALGTGFAIVGYHLGGSPDLEARDVEPSTLMLTPSPGGMHASWRF